MITRLEKVLKQTKELMPYGSINNNLTMSEARAFFYKYNILSTTPIDIENKDLPKIKALIAHAMYASAMKDMLEPLFKSDPRIKLGAFLKAANILIRHGSANCEIAFVTLYVALLEKIFPIEHAHISEYHTIVVVGRKSDKKTLSLEEVRSLPDDVFGICAHGGYVFPLNQLFQSEQSLAFYHPDALTAKAAPLHPKVGLTQGEHIFRSDFIMEDEELLKHSEIKELMTTIGNIKQPTDERAFIEITYSTLTAKQINPKYDAHADLVEQLTVLTSVKPRLKTFLNLVMKNEYNKALRTAANDETDGALVLILLLSFKDKLAIKINDKGEVSQLAAIDYAFTKKNKENYKILIRHGATPPQTKATLFSATSSPPVVPLTAAKAKTIKKGANA